MWMYYLIALIPPVIGAILWIRMKEIVLWEWLVCSAVGFLTSAIIHAILVGAMTADTETWSGQIVSAVYYPKWIEEYTEYHTKTDSKGNTSTYTTTEHRTHHPKWEVDLNFGSIASTWDISDGFFAEIKKNFGGEVVAVPGRRPGFDGGDKNDYRLRNKTGYIYPTTMTKHFENRVKCSKNVFSYIDVPEDAPVFDYPKNDNSYVSDRLLGTAKNAITILAWDRLNTKLGPNKKINLILIGFGDSDSGMAQLQEAKWIGGKKNDLVLCYGGPANEPTWSYVFGWSESELVKRNLETILLYPINDDLLPKIEAEVFANYEIKDWSKFDYIAVDAPWWGLIVLVVVMTLTQFFLGCFMVNNEFTKDSIGHTSLRDALFATKKNGIQYRGFRRR